MGNTISKYKVLQEILFRGRWHVVLDMTYKLYLGQKARRKMQKANYIWLLGNPSFEYIPTGYVIHHLDNDQLNDDISNLVLMQKHHHAAHHWKQKTIDTEIVISNKAYAPKRSVYTPDSEPKIRFKKDRGIFFLDFYEKFAGERMRKNLYKYDGQNFKTHKQAEIAKQKIWPVN